MSSTALLLCVIVIAGVAAVTKIAIYLLDKYLPTDFERANRDAEELIRNANRPKRRAIEKP